MTKDILSDICIYSSKLEFLNQDLEKLRQIRRTLEHRDPREVIEQLKNMDYFIERHNVYSVTLKTYLYYSELLQVLVNKINIEIVDFKSSMWEKIDNKKRIIDVSSKEILDEKDVKLLERYEKNLELLKKEQYDIQQINEKIFEVMKKYFIKFKKNDGYYYQLENKSSSWKSSLKDLNYLEHFDKHYFYLENEIRRYHTHLKELKANDINTLMKI